MGPVSCLPRGAACAGSGEEGVPGGGGEDEGWAGGVLGVSDGDVVCGEVGYFDAFTVRCALLVDLNHRAPKLTATSHHLVTFTAGRTPGALEPLRVLEAAAALAWSAAILLNSSLLSDTDSATRCAAACARRYSMTVSGRL